MPPVYKPPPSSPPIPPNIGPSNFWSLLNINFIKNVFVPQVFSCILLVQFIYLVSSWVEILPILIPEDIKHHSNKQQTQSTIIWSKSTIETVYKKWKVFKVNHKEIRMGSMVSLLLALSLTLHILVSLLLTLNIFHILHDMKYAKIQGLYWKKEGQVIGLTDCKLKC